MSVAGCDNMAACMCDMVHHDYSGSCPSVLQGFPAECTDHLTGTTSGPVVSSGKSCLPPFDSFQLLDVGLCVGV